MINENKEIQKSMIESINKMIENNSYGLSGFMKGYQVNCGNAAIFPELFEAYNGLHVEKDFFCCPYQKDVLFGTEDLKKSRDNCRDNCLKNIFIKNKDLRKEILERFKTLLEQDYYLDCLENNKSVEPLLTKWEQTIIESYEDKKTSVFEKEQQLQTERNYLNNMLHFKGTKDDPLNEELFGFWARFMTEENKTTIERFKKSANTSMVHNIHWDLTDEIYEKDENGEYFYNHVMACPLLVASPIYRTDCFIQMSLFDCVELNQTLFHFGMNSNNIILPATEDLKEFYNKYKREVKGK